MSFDAHRMYARGPFRTSPQPYYGPIYDQGEQTTRALEPWTRNIGLVGQLNPARQENDNMRHGRNLSGLGAAPPLTRDGSDPRYESGHLKSLEQQDDTFGSGIFDGPEGEPTANAEMGIFSSAYALPGYVGREVPFAVSRDITDITEGGAVVMVPAGGKAVIESGGHFIDPPVIGPTPRPPHMKVPGHTGIDQVYVNLQPGPAPDALHPQAPMRPMPTYHPRRPLTRPMVPLPPSRMARRIPPYPPSRIMPYRSIVNPLGGTTDEGVTWGQMAIAGAMIGVAYAMYRGATKAKG